MKTNVFLIICVFLLSLALMLISGCTKISEDYDIKRVESSDEKCLYELPYVENGYLQVIEIDGCEYLYGIRGIGQNRVGFLTHKGNCKYCAERNAQHIHY